jgi:arylsulfatase A-like enzyme
LEALEETDQYDNTIIVFLSDNGGRRVETNNPESGMGAILTYLTLSYSYLGTKGILLPISESSE